MRILFAGGGTAGHINPAIAIANFIRERYSNAEIAFVGTKNGMENTLVPQEGYKLYLTDVKGFKRKVCVHNVKAVKCAFNALSDSEKIIKEFKPDVIVGTGGYVSGPVLYKGAKMGIKTVIHEQNAFPGLTSKILSRYVDEVLISFDDSKKYFKNPRKITLTGNPIRPNMVGIPKKSAKAELGLEGDKKLLACFSGSLGAQKINDAMVEIINNNKNDIDFSIIFATGVRYYDDVCKRIDSEVLAKTHPNIKIEKYINNMGCVMSGADLLVCRSGAITLAELAVLQKASILVPSPNVTGNHQYFNALEFKNAGASEMLEEKDLTSSALYLKIRGIIKDEKAIKDMEEGAKKLAKPGATEQICNIIINLLK